MSPLTESEKIGFAQSHTNLIRMKYVSPPGDGPYFWWENTTDVPVELHGQPIIESEWEELLRPITHNPLLKNFNKELPPYEENVLFIWKSKGSGDTNASVGHYRMVEDTERVDRFKVAVLTDARTFIGAIELSDIHLFWMPIPKLS